MNKFEALKTILKPYVANTDLLENINSETDFIKDLEINSADLVDIILDIEDQFDIIINEDAMQKMMNVATALTVIEIELAKK